MATYTIPPPTEKILHFHATTKAERKQEEAWLRRQWKKDSEEVCPLCTDPIGYNRPCFDARDMGARFVHAACYMRKIEDERKAEAS